MHLAISSVKSSSVDETKLSSVMMAHEVIQLHVPDSGHGLAFTAVLPAPPSPSTHISAVLAGLHAGYFLITLSLAAQSLLLKTAIVVDRPGTGADSTDDPLHRLLVTFRPTALLLVLWSLTLVTLITLSLVYFLRCVFRFELVKAEFLNSVAVNYLFAPWISWLLLIQAAPFAMPGAAAPYLVLWWVLAVPVVALDLKIYGQWFTKGKRFLSTVANPTNQLSVIANLVAAQAGARLAWREAAFCLFSLGIVHYTVLFVTLRQQLSGDGLISPVLRPTFFLLFAAPSVASLAWESIAGGFDTSSKMLFYLSLFLFTSLVCRPRLFRRSIRRFNVAWWAYSFPLTVLASASVGYAREVKGCIPRALMVILTALSALVSMILTILTLLKAKRLLLDDDPNLTVIEQRLPSTM